MGAVFAVFAGWYFLIPKIFGFTLGLGLSNIQFLVLSLKVNNLLSTWLYVNLLCIKNYLQRHNINLWFIPNNINSLPRCLLFIEVVNIETIYLIWKVLNIILLLIFGINNILEEDFLYMNSDPSSSSGNQNQPGGEIPGNQPSGPDNIITPSSENEDDKTKTEKLKTENLEKYEHPIKHPSNCLNNRLNEIKSKAGVKDITIKKSELTNKKVLENLEETKKQYLAQKKFKEEIVKRIQEGKEPFFPSSAQDSLSNDVKLIDLLVKNIDTQIKSIKSHDSIIK